MFLVHTATDIRKTSSWSSYQNRLMYIRGTQGHDLWHHATWHGHWTVNPYMFIRTINGNICHHIEILPLHSLYKNQEPMSVCLPRDGHYRYFTTSDFDLNPPQRRSQHNMWICHFMWAMFTSVYIWVMCCSHLIGWCALLWIQTRLNMWRRRIWHKNMYTCKIACTYTYYTHIANSICMQQ